RARALGGRVASDDELLAELALELEPVAGAFPDVLAVALLRHDALEPLGARRVEELLPVAEHMVAEVDDAAPRPEELEARLALLQRQAPEAAPVERERVGEHRA